jgi:hypothetical protein
MGYKHSIDPYAAMLNESERKAIGYGFLTSFLLVLAFLVVEISTDGAGKFSSLVESVQSTVGLFLLCASGLSILISIWFIVRYVYFFKRPERSDY